MSEQDHAKRSSVSEQEQIRRESLDALRELGLDPYPAEGWNVTAHATDVLDRLMTGWGDQVHPGARVAPR